MLRISEGTWSNEKILRYEDEPQIVDVHGWNSSLPLKWSNSFMSMLLQVRAKMGPLHCLLDTIKTGTVCWWGSFQRTNGEMLALGEVRDQNHILRNSSWICFLCTIMGTPICSISFFFRIFRAAPAAYGGFQARGPIGAVAAGLRQSHSKAGSKLILPPTPQLTATPDP